MATDQGPQLSELLTRLQALGYSADTATQQTAFLNATQREIIGMRRWQFQEDTITRTLPFNTSIFDLTAETTFAEVDALNVLDGTDRFLIEPETMQSYRHRQWEYQGSTGTPLYWARYGDDLRFTPTTDKAYTAELDVLILPTAMSAGSDRTIIPGRHSDVLVWGAARFLAYRHRDAISSKAMADSEFAAAMRALITAYPLIHRQASGHVQRSDTWNAVGGGSIQWRA